VIKRFGPREFSDRVGRRPARGDHPMLLRFIVRSVMPVLGCVGPGASCGARVIHNRGGLSIAPHHGDPASFSSDAGQAGRGIGDGSCQWSCRKLRSPNGKRPSQHRGVARAVVLMPGRAALEGPRRGTEVLTLASALASLFSRANPTHQPAGMIRFRVESGSRHAGSFSGFAGPIDRLSCPRGSGGAGRWSL
jgi:hypothetical protein